MLVDLSATGEFKASFSQTCHLSHSAGICLLLQPDGTVAKTWSNRLSEARFVCRLFDGNGNERVREEFTAPSWVKPSWRQRAFRHLKAIIRLGAARGACPRPDRTLRGPKGEAALRSFRKLQRGDDYQAAMHRCRALADELTADYRNRTGTF